MGWDLFEKSSSTLERHERVLGAAEGEYEFAAARGAWSKLFPDTIISQEKRSIPDRKRWSSDRQEKRTIASEIDAADLVTGGQGVTQPMKLTHMMQKKTRTPKRQSCARKSQT